MLPLGRGKTASCASVGVQHLSRLALDDTAVSEKDGTSGGDSVIKVKAVFLSVRPKCSASPPPVKVPSLLVFPSVLRRLKTILGPAVLRLVPRFATEMRECVCFPFFDKQELGYKIEK